ncbi:UNVERIFIED_CONTAM: hypothetical protein RMT77_005646 [Armadillidium vulgare]
MADDPTVILKSIQDLKKFVGKGKSRESSQDSIKSSPNIKLNFSDSSGLDFETSFGANNDLPNISFLQKHQQSIAGFDITQKLAEKDRQILECKTTISVLEGKLENLKSLYRNTRIDHETELEKYKTKQFQDKEKIQILEEKVRKFTEAKKNTQEEMFKNREIGEFHRSQKEKNLIERNKFYAEKLNELQEKATDLENSKYDLMKMIDEKSTELEIQESENNRLEEIISRLQSQVADLQSTKRDLDLLKTKLHQSVTNNKELESRLDCLKEQENKMQLFEDTIMKLPVLQKEIAKLKEDNNMHKITRLNIDLLKEQLTSAENRLQLMEIKCRDLTEENATLVTLRDLSEQYESVIRREFQLDYLPPVTEFLDILKNLKKRDEEVEQSLNELRASIESHSSSKEKQEEINKKLKSELEECHFEMTKNATIIKRLQRKIFLLSMERDSLKRVIESYQSEATLNPSAVEQERINHLETQLSNYKKEVSKLEEELDKAQQLPKYESKSEDKGESSSEISCSNKDAEVEGSLTQLKEENEMLKAQIEHYGNLGVHDPTKAKVIHFRDNPLEKAYNERKASYDKLSEENEALKKRVQLLEEGVTSDLTEKVGMKVETEEVNSKFVKELEEKVNSLEMQKKRLMEVYKEKSHEMREIVYRLLGYRVDFKSDNNYKLSSMYAESEEDYLLFKQTSDGKLELLENEFSESLEDFVESYLNRDCSFPAFLSHLTLNLYGKQTIMPSSSDQEEYEGGEEEEEEAMGDEEEEEFMGEEEEEEEENVLEPAAKRPRQDLEDEEEEEEEEEDEEEDNEEDEDDDELICLD